jgi:hypothetical protein
MMFDAFWGVLVQLSSNEMVLAMKFERKVESQRDSQPSAVDQERWTPTRTVAPETVSDEMFDLKSG